MAEEYENYDTMEDEARDVLRRWEAESPSDEQDVVRIEQQISEGLQMVLRRLDALEANVQRLNNRPATPPRREGAPEKRLEPRHPPIRDKDELDTEAAWGLVSPHEPRWPASLAVVAAIVLYVLLPDKLIWINTRWAVPILEAALLLPLSVIAPHRHIEEATWRRVLAIGLIVVINAANLASLVLLVNNLITGHARASGTDLIFAAADIWLTNVIVFALWYWELDRGGPGARCKRTHRTPDFLFPQMVTPEAAVPTWAPRFIDYLYVSFTNAEAFSPTDTMPLTHWAKSLMLTQSVASVITIALVAARAVNILS